MTFEELLKFIDMEDKRLRDFYNNTDIEKRILARTVKLNEEVGELCDEVLGYNNDQRNDKLHKYSNESLSNEIADVIITTLLIAKSTNVDVKKVLNEKIEKINKRYDK